MKNGKDIFNQWLDYCANNRKQSIDKHDIENLFENLSNRVNNLTPIHEKNQTIVGKESTAENTISLPQFRISEQFGQRGANDDDLRAFIDTIVKNIRGSTWQERVKSLEKILGETCDAACAKSTSTSQLISSLIFLDCLATIIYEFSTSSAGFIFESFMATLMGFDVKRIPAAKGELLDIASDVKTEDGLSIKLIIKDSKVKGSYAALLDYFVKYNKPAPYLIVIKGGKSAEAATSLNFYEVAMFPSPEVILKAKNVVDEKTAQKFLNSLPKGQGIYYVDQQDDVKGTQFNINTNKLLKNSILKANLSFGNYSELKKKSTLLVSYLQNDINIAFQNLNNLIKNLTLYFADADGGRAKAVDAENNAQQIIKILSKQSKK